VSSHGQGCKCARRAYHDSMSTRDTIYPPTASESPLARFPSFPPWATFHELAEQRLGYEGAASLYLSLAPAETGEIRDRREQEHALIDDLRKLVAEAEATAPDHDARLALRALPDRIDEFLADYRPAGRHVHGVAVFATPDGYLRAVDLPESVGDEISVETSPRIAPLFSLVSRSHEALIVMVDQEHGRTLVWAQGAAQEACKWSNRRNLTHHLKGIAEGVGKATRTQPRPIVLIGPEELRGEFGRHLDAASRDLVTGWTSVEPHQPTALIAAAARPVLAAWWARREREMLDSWHEAAAKHTHGVAGFEDVLAAASDGAVDVLFFQEAPPVSWPVAFECENDGRASLTPGACPLDGGRLLPRRRGLEAVLRETLRYGGKAFAVRDAEDLARAQGIGAMTRF
jgi:hypothetical protein